MKHSVKNRLFIGGGIGLGVGLFVFLFLLFLGGGVALTLGLGLMIFYVILGFLTAFLGMMEHHPVFQFKTPWWLRGIVAGLIMHSMLVLLTYDQLSGIMHNLNILGMTSPWWALIDGIILGFIMSWAETKWAGEGKLSME